MGGTAIPRASATSAATTEGPPDTVTMARLASLGRGAPPARAWMASKSSSVSPHWTTPAARNAAACTSAAPASEPV